MNLKGTHRNPDNKLDTDTLHSGSLSRAGWPEPCRCSFKSGADPEIICLNKKIWSQIPANYELHWNCSKDKTDYSGVAVFIKFKPLSVTHDIGVDRHDR